MGTAPITVTGNVYTGQGVWNQAASGSWGSLTSMSNWTTSGGAPGLDPSFLATDSATFGSAATSGPVTVSLNGASPSLAA